MDPLTLMVVGTGMQVIGQWSANMAQAEAERLNQKYFEEQAIYARQSAQRAEGLAAFEYAYKIGQQTGAYAAAGVDTSGSAAFTIGGTIANEISEISAIRRKGEMDVRLARMRMTNAGKNADTLSSTGYNVMQALTTGIGNYAQSEGFGKWNQNRPGVSDKYPGYGSGINNAALQPSTAYDTADLISRTS